MAYEGVAEAQTLDRVPVGRGLYEQVARRAAQRGGSARTDQSQRPHVYGDVREGAAEQFLRSGVVGRADRHPPPPQLLHVRQRVQPGLGCYQRANLADRAGRRADAALAVLRLQRDVADAPLQRPVVPLVRVVRVDAVREQVHRKIEGPVRPDVLAYVQGGYAVAGVVRVHRSYGARVVGVAGNPCDIKNTMRSVALIAALSLPGRAPGLKVPPRGGHARDDWSNLRQRVRHDSCPFNF